MSDPVFERINIFTLRTLLFGLLAIGTASALWYYILVEWYGYQLSQLWNLASAAYHNQRINGSAFHMVTLWFCVGGSISLVLNIYLFTAWRWRKNGYIHHRGVVLEDCRGNHHV